MFRPIWPSQSVIIIIVLHKLLCPFVLILAGPCVCAGVSLGDGPLSLCYYDSAILLNHHRLICTAN
jgi:hypothetical protein